MVNSIDKPNNVYSPDQKMAAAAEYYLTGSSEKAAKNLGGTIPGRTIRYWIANDALFKSHYEEMLEANQQESQAKYRDIIQKGLDALADRIENGNRKVERIELQDEDGKPKVDERGRVCRESVEYREPMTSKDLTYTTGIMIDKYRVSLGQPSRITKAAQSQDDLLNTFRQIASEFDHKKNEKVVSSD